MYAYAAESLLKRWFTGAEHIDERLFWLFLHLSDYEVCCRLRNEQ